MDKIRFEFGKPLTTCQPALDLAHEVMTEYTARGIGQRANHIQWDDEYVLAYVNDKPVGVITFLYVKHRAALHITNGYVKPDHRRTGVYSALWRELVAFASTYEEKVLAIESGTHPDNVEMNTFCRKMGRVHTTNGYDFDIDYRGPEKEEKKPGLSKGLEERTFAGSVDPGTDLNMTASQRADFAEFFGLELSAMYPLAIPPDQALAMGAAWQKHREQQTKHAETAKQEEKP